MDSYNKDAYKVRASDILQRAKSLENLVELSLTKNRFLPNYIEFTETFNEKIDNVRKPILRSSAVFPVVRNENYTSRINFLGYWLIKRNIPEVHLLITLRDCGPSDGGKQ